MLAGGGTDRAGFYPSDSLSDRHFVEDGTSDRSRRRRLAFVLHTPGHSPGSLTSAPPGSGRCCSADTVRAAVHIWDDIPGADRPTLQMSHERLAEVDFARACPGHGAHSAARAFLDRIRRYRRQASA